MASVKKYTRVQMQKIFAHDSRQPDENRSRKNESINSELTGSNYNLAKDFQLLKASEFVRKRMENVYVYADGKPKGDKAIGMFEWIITLPKDVLAEREQEFFRHILDFMCDKYGKQNIVSAWVHKDETTPHMHVDILPIVERKVSARSHNRKDGKTEKLDCKNVLTKNHLDTWHQQCSDYIYEHMGQRYAVLNGATANGNRTVEQLKSERLARQNQEEEERNQQLLYQNQILENINREMLFSYTKQATGEVQNWIENANSYISGKVKKSGKEIVQLAEQIPHIQKLIEGLQTCQKMSESELYKNQIKAQALKQEREEFIEYKADKLRQFASRERQICERDRKLTEQAAIVFEKLNEVIQQKAQQLLEEQLQRDEQHKQYLQHKADCLAAFEKYLPERMQSIEQSGNDRENNYERSV